MSYFVTHKEKEGQSETYLKLIGNERYPDLHKKALMSLDLY